MIWMSEVDDDVKWVWEINEWMRNEIGFKLKWIVIFEKWSEMSGVVVIWMCKLMKCNMDDNEKYKKVLCLKNLKPTKFDSN